MEFRVLGPLEVVGPHGPIRIAGRLQRAILALLVLHGGETVTTDRLVDDVWGDQPPRGPQHAAEVHVARLRQALGSGRIEAHAGGYRLRVEGTDVDLRRFQALVSDASGSFDGGDPAAAAEGYAAALRMWRGPALADLAAGDLLRAERAHLDELHTVVLERWIDAELAAGHHLDVIPELRRLSDEMPLREAFQTRLMLALYRGGRQSEALEVYLRARAILDRELGIEPGPELEALQQSVLAHDPSLDVARAGVSGQSAAPSKNFHVAPARASETSPDRTPSRRVVTTLVAEISASTPAGERLDPETDRPLVDRCLAEMRAVAGRHGGQVGQPGGDTMMVVFGIPATHEDDALRAVRAASEMREVAANLSADTGPQLGLSIAMRAGINTGEIVADRAVSSAALITGEAVNVARRLEQAAGPGEILLDISTYELVRSAVDAEPIEPPGSRGPSGVDRAYRLRAVTPGFRGHARRFDTPLVGRDRELQQLQAALNQVIVQRTCQIFSILGPAGVGKSRLAHEFLRSVRPAARVLRGRCLPYGERVALWPVAETISQAAGIQDGDAAEVARGRIAALVAGHPRATAIAERVAAVVGASQVPSTSDETSWAVRSVFESLAQERPLVVVFDDVQWGEPSFLDLVESVANSRGVPMLLICIARPELLDVRPGWGGGKLNATSVLLEPLTEPEVVQLTANLLGDSRPPVNVEQKIVETAEGNPLFVEEFLAMLLDDGVIRRAGREWVATTDLGTISTPASIMALLAARLDRLPADERHVLEHASVVGKVFSLEAVRALTSPDERPDVDRRLDALVRREMIRPDRSASRGDEAYRFKHILIRDAAYAGLTKQERIVLHERLAVWLASSEEDDRPSPDEVIGAHLERAYRYRTELGPIDERARSIGRMAAARLGAVGRRAHVRGDAGVAEGMLVRAAAILPTDDRERLVLLADLTEAQIERVEFEPARRTIDELVELARAAGMDDLNWRATLYRTELDMFAARDVSLQITEDVRRAIEFFETAGDDRALALAWFLIGALELGRGHYADGRIANERAIDHARSARDLRAEGRSLVELTWIDVYGRATVMVATRTAQSLLDWARDAGVPGTEAIALGYLGRLKAMIGEFDAARRLVEAAGTLSSQLGRRYLVAGNISWWMGFVEWLAGDPAAAARELRFGYDQLERLGDRTMRPELAADLARMLYLQDNLDEAFHYTQIAQGFAHPTEARVGINWQGVGAMILARRGEQSAALALAQAAVSAAEATDVLLYHARAVEDLAEVLELSGHSDEAQVRLAEAVRLYDQKGITVLADRARRKQRALQR